MRRTRVGTISSPIWKEKREALIALHKACHYAYLAAQQHKGEKSASARAVRQSFENRGDRLMKDAKGHEGMF